MIAEAYKDDFWSEEEMAKILRWKQKTLRERIYAGRNHPPYKEILGQRVFNKAEVREWLLEHKTVYEVKSSA